jgi:Uma2 family endonuclease
MIVKSTVTLYTPDDLLNMPDASTHELVDGRLIERKPSAWSSLVEGYIGARLLNYAWTNRIGSVWPGTMGYQISPNRPNTIRKPHVSFIRKEKLSPDVMENDFIKIVPDLVVEMLSPNDLVYEVDRKIVEYKRAGVRLIWVVNPETRSVAIYRPNGTASILNDTDTIKGEDVLPSFECPVSSFFSKFGGAERDQLSLTRTPSIPHCTV